VVGGESGFRPVGFLFIVSPALVPALEKNVETLAGMGVVNRVVDGAALRELQPFMDPAGVGAAAYEPESGFADPSDSIGSLLAGVRRHGGRVRVERGPVRPLAAGWTVAGGRAGTEETAAPAVVLAAGAGTRELAAQLGVDLPVFPMPIGAGLVHWAPPAKFPMCVIDHPLE